MKISNLVKTSNGVKKVICLGLLLIAMLAAGGCSLYGNSQTSAPRAAPLATPPATPADNSGAVNPVITPPTPAAPQNNTSAINIENFSFNPSAVTVKKSSTITWTNNDSVPHQIKSATFNSEVLNKGQNFSFTFDQAGTFNYSCAIHPAMTGQIIVQ